MYWASSKCKAGLYLLAFGVMCLPGWAAAETGVVSAVGSGRDTSEAIVGLLRSVVGKYFQAEPATLSKSVLLNEVVPNANSFVQSYRILEGRKGAVSLSANVDLDVINALFRLTPAQLGEAAGARALVVTRGARLPEAAEPAKGAAPVPNPYALLEGGAKERFVRRQFDVVGLSQDELAALGPGDDVASPELLRGLGARAGARLAFGLTSRYETYENENSHNKEQRIVLSATLVDVKSGVVLGRSSVNVNDPKSRREQYVSDLQRSFGEEGKDLFHDVFVSAGKRLAKVPGKEDFSLVRVQYPSNSGLLNKFRTLLETAKGLQSVVEYGVTRGAFDLAVRPAMKGTALAKIIKTISSDEINIALLESIGQDGVGKAPDVVVKLSPKEVPAPVGEVQGEP